MPQAASSFCVPVSSAPPSRPSSRAKPRDPVHSEPKGIAEARTARTERTGSRLEAGMTFGVFCVGNLLPRKAPHRAAFPSPAPPHSLPSSRAKTRDPVPSKPKGIAEARTATTQRTGSRLKTGMTFGVCCEGNHLPRPPLTALRSLPRLRPCLDRHPGRRPGTRYTQSPRVSLRPEPQLQSVLDPGARPG